jgi:exopolyphosphatase/guanosine-5'-triphosphate,3'-diphosphate pyrophosphatase
VREVVRLGGGLTADKRIDRATQARALESLAKLAERLRGFPRQAVRAVGTNALRVAKNAPQFLREARQVLGFPIEVISGREEARLIYLGVGARHAGRGRLEDRASPGGRRRRRLDRIHRRHGLEPQLTESLYMGCVSYSLKYFPDGKVDKAAMRAAELAARQELAGICARLPRGRMGRGGGVLGHRARHREHPARERLRRRRPDQSGPGKTEIAAGEKRRRRIRTAFAGLRPNRAPVLPGGLAILHAAIRGARPRAMKVSGGALRHGVLYDLLGRVEHRDMREATVAQFMRRYHVDPAQAERVKQLALTIYDALTPGAEREDDADRLMLEWAARLAEIGLSIAHAQYHKHSAYVLSNADMPGFSRMEQARLARIVLAHRGKLRKMQDAGSTAPTGSWCSRCGPPSLILRSRSDAKLPFLRVAADAGGFAIDLPQSWLDESPLSAAALEAEADHWKTVGMKLRCPAFRTRRVFVSLKQVR